MRPFHASICTVVTQAALDSFHEIGSTKGSFKDQHPWYVARELLVEAQTNDLLLPLIFVTEETLKVSHWALIDDIDVTTYAKHSHESRCTFYDLQRVSLIFEQLDSLTLLPPREQIHRESLEPIRVLRNHLDEIHLRPYAICETPPFVSTSLDGETTTETPTNQ